MGRLAQRKIVNNGRISIISYILRTPGAIGSSYEIRSWRNSPCYGMYWYLCRACLVSNCQSRRTCSSLNSTSPLFHLLSLFTATLTFHHSSYWQYVSYPFLICLYNSCFSCSQSRISWESWLRRHAQARKYSALHNPGYSCIRTLMGTHPEPRLIKSAAGWMGFSWY